MQLNLKDVELTTAHDVHTEMSRFSMADSQDAAAIIIHHPVLKMGMKAHRLILNVI